MSKVIIRYESIEEREKIIRALSIVMRVKSISKSVEIGKYKRICIELE